MRLQRAATVEGGHSEGVLALVGQRRPVIRADRVRLDVIAIELDDLARHCAEQVAGREPFVEARARLGQREAQRVAIERSDAVDLAVVVERLLLVEGRLAKLG